MKKQTTPLKNNKTAFGIAALALLVMLVACMFLCKLFWENNAVTSWNEERFTFASGASCMVIQEPKLVIFHGDGGEDEVFDSINGRGSSFINGSNPFFGWGNASSGLHTRTTRGGKMTYQFLGSKCKMEMTARGTLKRETIPANGTFFYFSMGSITVNFHTQKPEVPNGLRFHLLGVSYVSVSEFTLTLDDGRKFTLDGKTPLWLRIKSDGMVIELDELPEGFIEYFESPIISSDFGSRYKQAITSYPDAFRKAK